MALVPRERRPGAINRCLGGIAVEKGGGDQGTEGVDVGELGRRELGGDVEWDSDDREDKDEDEGSEGGCVGDTAEEW